jgi:tRNA A37 threonylcarbamoyladenosine synthetase subunit TsaC/SUA5/YrdC
MGPAATASPTLLAGGLTVVVPQRPDVPLPAALTGGTPTIGLRVPDHDAPRALAGGSRAAADHLGQCLRPARGRDAAEILDQLGDGVDLILDGGRGARRAGLDRGRLHAGAAGRPARRCHPVARLAAILDAAGIAHDLVSG